MRYLFLAICLFALPANALMAQPDANGLWLTENQRSVIRIEPCEQGTCGYIHWIIKGGMQYDTKNPDESRRNQPMCGLPILWGFKQKDDTTWTNGQIYKADDGDIYKSNMKMMGPDALKVRGYVGLPMFGKSQIWKRVSAKDYPACRKPK